MFECYEDVGMHVFREMETFLPKFVRSRLNVFLCGLARLFMSIQVDVLLFVVLQLETQLLLFLDAPVMHVDIQVDVLWYVWLEMVKLLLFGLVMFVGTDTTSTAPLNIDAFNESNSDTSDMDERQCNASNTLPTATTSTPTKIYTTMSDMATYLYPTFPTATSTLGDFPDAANNL